jgi:hypothetical protein
MAAMRLAHDLFRWKRSRRSSACKDWPEQAAGSVIVYITACAGLTVSSRQEFPLA